MQDRFVAPWRSLPIGGQWLLLAQRHAVWHKAAVNSLAQAVRGWLNAGLSFVYPELCQLCRIERAGPEQCFVCDSCQNKVHFVKPPFCARCGLPYRGEIFGTFECGNCREAQLVFSFARSAVVAGDQVLEVIHQYKYQRALWFEPLLSQWLIRAAVPELLAQTWDKLIPVPLYPAREREREFNQAERLALRLSKAAGIPVENRWLKRIRATQSQTRLTRQERQENMHKAFAVRKEIDPSGQRLVLVDDVMTTGATTNACARALLKAGASEVCVWTVARGV